MSEAVNNFYRFAGPVVESAPLWPLVIFIVLQLAVMAFVAVRRRLKR